MEMRAAAAISNAAHDVGDRLDKAAHSVSIKDLGHLDHAVKAKSKMKKVGKCVV